MLLPSQSVAKIPTLRQRTEGGGDGGDVGEGGGGSHCERSAERSGCVNSQVNEAQCA